MSYLARAIIVPFVVVSVLLGVGALFNNSINVIVDIFIYAVFLGLAYFFPLIFVRMYEYHVIKVRDYTYANCYTWKPGMFINLGLLAVLVLTFPIRIQDEDWLTQVKQQTSHPLSYDLFWLFFFLVSPVLNVIVSLMVVQRAKKYAEPSRSATQPIIG